MWFRKSLLFGFITILFCSTPGYSFLLPTEQIIRNNASQKQFLKTAVISHTIEFLNGFFSSEPFSCKETIYFKMPETFRLDYECGGIAYSFLKTQKKSSGYYQKKISLLSSHPISTFLSLFLVRDPELLFQSLANDEFITAEAIKPDFQEEPKDADDKNVPPRETEWNINGDVSLKRLGNIEARTDNKLERNVNWVITSPVSGSKILWIEKDLFYPQKIELNGRDILFKNYRDKETRPTEKKTRRSFIYPQLIEIQESGITGISLHIQWEECQVNSPLSPEVFSSSGLLKKNSLFALSDHHKETLEKFVREFRGLDVAQ